jgi:hypothetical protein
MVNEQPLGPGDEEYRTPVVTRDVAPGGDPLEPGSATAGESSPPWIVIGVVLLVVFAAILVYAVVVPVLT